MKARVAAIETPDPRHVRFKLKEPWPDFLTFYGSATGAGWVVPKKYVEKVGDDGFKKAPIGAGPYKFVVVQPRRRAGAGGVRAAIGARRRASSAWCSRCIPDEATRLAALKRGEVDGIYSIRGELAEELQRTPGPDAQAGRSYRRAFWLYFPEQWDPKSPWHDVRVRQAASLAIDREGINQAITLGYSQADRQRLRAGALRILLAAAAAGLRPGQGEAAAGGGGPSRTASTPARSIATRRSRISARRSSTTCARSASGPICGRSSAPRSSRAIPRRSTKGLIMGGSAAFGNAATRLEAFVGQGRRLRLWQLSRYRRAVPAAGGRARPREARGDAAQDAAARARKGRSPRRSGSWRLLNGVGPRVGEFALRADAAAIPGPSPYEDITLKGA